MGRPRLDIPVDDLREVIATGANQKEIAKHFNTSVLTIQKRITEAKAEEGVILDFKVMQAGILNKAKALILDKILTELENDNIEVEQLPKLYEVIAKQSAAIESPEKDKGVEGIVDLLIRLEEEMLDRKEMTPVIDLADDGRLPQNSGMPRLEN